MLMDVFIKITRYSAFFRIEKLAPFFAKRQRLIT